MLDKLVDSTDRSALTSPIRAQMQSPTQGTTRMLLDGKECLKRQSWFRMTVSQSGWRHLSVSLAPAFQLFETLNFLHSKYVRCKNWKLPHTWTEAKFPCIIQWVAYSNSHHKMEHIGLAYHVGIKDEVAFWGWREVATPVPHNQRYKPRRLIITHLEP